MSRLYEIDFNGQTPTTAWESLTPGVGANAVTKLSGNSLSINAGGTRLMSPSAFGHYITSETFGTANYRVGVTTRFEGPDTGLFSLIMARRADGSNNYLLSWSESSVAIEKFVGGSPETLDTYSVSTSAGQTRTLELIVNGTNLYGLVDGVVQLEVTGDASHAAAGQVALMTGNTNGGATGSRGWEYGTFYVDSDVSLPGASATGAMIQQLRNIGAY